MSSRRYQFGDWLVEPELNRISSGTVERHLEPLTMDVLCHLLEHAGNIISSESMLATVWDGKVVESNAVPRAINQIRTVLDDDSRAPRYIETIRGRGYRTIAVVRESDGLSPGSFFRTLLHPLRSATGSGQAPDPILAPSATARHRVRWVVGVLGVVALSAAIFAWWLALPTAQSDGEAQYSSIAILPFRDLSPGEDMGWLAAGLAAQLRAHLGQVEGLRVLPRAAVVEQPARGSTPLQTPEQLSASVLLDGTVQVTGDEVRVGLTMIDLRTQEQVWSHEFHGTASDPIELQESVLYQILRFLNYLRLDQQAPGRVLEPDSRTAQIAWFRYQGHRYTGGLQAMRLLEEVVRTEPTFGVAHIDLGWSYIQLAREYADVKWVSKAHEALYRARSLGMTEHPSWQMAIGTLLWQFEARFDEAESQFRPVLENGAAVYGHWMLASGLVREARAYAEVLVKRLPYVATSWSVLANARALDGDVVGAHEAAVRVAQLIPADASWMNYMLYWTLPTLGRLDEAEAHLALLREQLSRNQGSPYLQLMALTLEFNLAMARRDPVAATQAAESLANNGWHAIAGILYLVLEDERASEELEAASQPPFFRRNNVPFYLLHLPVRRLDDPRVRRMLDAMGLTEAWRLEFCRRISDLPRETALDCDPTIYESS